MLHKQTLPLEIGKEIYSTLLRCECFYPDPKKAHQCMFLHDICKEGKGSHRCQAISADFVVCPTVFDIKWYGLPNEKQFERIAYAKSELVTVFNQYMLWKKGLLKPYFYA